MEYDEDSFLMISGIQHFTFCRRQWALIHIEQLWDENLRTVQGEIMHENAHDSSFIEKRGNIITVRDMKVFSRELGISGACDVVEFISDENGVPVNGRNGKFKIRPVEYKHGEPKENDSDVLQLTAQAMCLEEMLCCQIDEGMLYYGKTHRRMSVPINNEVRSKVTDYTKQMHQMFERGYTPKVKPTKSCNACSLKNLCLPKLMRQKSAAEYLSSHMREG